jgi:hypothetical protein
MARPALLRQLRDPALLVGLALLRRPVFVFASMTSEATIRVRALLDVYMRKPLSVAERRPAL